MNEKKFKTIGTLIVAMLLIGTALAFTEDYLPAGTAISVDITAPSDGAVKVHPPGNVELKGTASMGEGLPIPDTLIVYVLDASGSTTAGGGCGGDQNNDGDSDTIMDCEILAAKELNELAVTTGTVGEVGVAVFASTGTTADVGPGTGEQLITGPDSDVGGASVWDVEEVLSSVYSQYGATGGVNLFTPKTVDKQTNFADGLTAAVQIVSASTVSNKIIVFMSDGGGSGSVMLGDLSTVAVPSDVIIKTFAIGSGSSCSYGTGSTPGSLDDVAAKGAAGSSCTPVPTVSDLPNVIPGVIAAELLSLECNVDGGAFATIPNTDIDPDLPAEDPVTVTFDHWVNGLAPGIHTLCVKATGSDSGGEGSVTDCIDVTIATIDLSPEVATNELPTPDHTVTATVAAGADGGVPGVEVNFEVLSGPNVGASGSDITDGNGEATFTYSATQGLDGLGTDVIEACFGPDEQGDTVCDTAEKNWVDTTPPVPDCLESVNPAGKNVPPAGSTTLPGTKGGQNEDGFYKLTATDAVDPNPLIFVVDTGSGTIFGPFVSDTNIKYTQSPGAAPVQKSIGGPNSAVAVHIKGTGDAAVFAVDASGNEAQAVSCLVPPPPK